MNSKIMPLFLFFQEKSLLFIVVFCFITLYLIPFSSQPQIKNRDSVSSRELIVKFKQSDLLNLVKIDYEENLSTYLESYNNNPEVDYAEPNFYYHSAIIPTDTFFENQWYLKKIKAVEAWNFIRESPSISIAVMDSGVQIDHPDLRDNIWVNLKEIPNNKIDDDKNGYIDDINGWDFVNSSPDPAPKFNADFTENGVLHGTIIAGIAAASGNNASGITGVSWKAKIIPLKVLDDKGEGSTLDVVRAIDYAIAQKANVVNFSFVGFGYSQSLQNAIERAYRAGIVVVAAAGNEQHEGEGSFLDHTPLYPVCHDGKNGENMVIGVAATDTIDRKTSFSGYGNKCIDIAAPGVSVFGAVVYSPTHHLNNKSFDKYYDGYWSGTSVAVPMVSATVSLIEAANPSLTRSQVVDILLGSTDYLYKINPDYDKQLGRGRLNVRSAVFSALDKLKSQEAYLIISPQSKNKSIVKVIDKNNKEINSFTAYENFSNGINITACDVNNDGNQEIITAPQIGGGPHIKIFNADGSLFGQFFAYESNFRGGVNLTCSDLNHDGFEEIITAPAGNFIPLVKIFNKNGSILNQFLAYDKNFKGGVNLAAGDVNGDNEIEIITGAGNGGGPQVRIFTTRGKAIGQFFAFDKHARSGVKVAIGDVDGKAAGDNSEIIASTGVGQPSNIIIFNDRGELKNSFHPYKNNFLGGLSVSAADIDNDGLAEIITGAGPGGTPHLRIFEINGIVIRSFYPFDESFGGGINVSSLIKKNN